MRSPLRLFAAMRLTAGMDVASEPNPRRRVRICRRLAVDSFLYGPRCRRARARGVGDESCATSVVSWRRRRLRVRRHRQRMLRALPISSWMAWPC
jgi:hypothetical protein